MPSFEVTQVANGFLVRPAYDIRQGHTMLSGTDVHVFPTWSEASKWLGDQFRQTSEPK